MGDRQMIQIADDIDTNNIDDIDDKGIDINIDIDRNPEIFP